MPAVSPIQRGLFFFFASTGSSNHKMSPMFLVGVNTQEWVCVTFRNAKCKLVLFIFLFQLTLQQALTYVYSAACLVCFTSQG